MQDGLKLNISDVENAQDPKILRGEVAEYFPGSPPARADEIILEVVSAVKQWRHIADNLKITRDEIERMAPAFRVAEAA